VCVNCEPSMSRGARVRDDGVFHGSTMGLPARYLSLGTQLPIPSCGSAGCAANQPAEGKEHPESTYPPEPWKKFFGQWSLSEARAPQTWKASPRRVSPNSTWSISTQFNATKYSHFTLLARFNFCTHLNGLRRWSQRFCLDNKTFRRCFHSSGISSKTQLLYGRIQRSGVLPRTFIKLYGLGLSVMYFAVEFEWTETVQAVCGWNLNCDTLEGMSWMSCTHPHLCPSWNPPARQAGTHRGRSLGRSVQEPKTKREEREWWRVRSTTVEISQPQKGVKVSSITDKTQYIL